MKNFIIFSAVLFFVVVLSLFSCSEPIGSDYSYDVYTSEGNTSEGNPSDDNFYTVIYDGNGSTDGSTDYVLHASF